MNFDENVISDPMEEKKLELERLITQKKSLEEQIKTMKLQQENYEKNPLFYDNLIILSNKIDELKDVYDDLQQKQTRLMDINQCLANRIQLSQTLISNKANIKRQLLTMLAEVDEILASIQ